MRVVNWFMALTTGQKISVAILSWIVVATATQLYGGLIETLLIGVGIGVVGVKLYASRAKKGL